MSWDMYPAIREREYFLLERRKVERRISYDEVLAILKDTETFRPHRFIFNKIVVGDDGFPVEFSDGEFPLEIRVAKDLFVVKVIVKEKGGALSIIMSVECK